MWTGSFVSECKCHVSIVPTYSCASSSQISPSTPVFAFSPRAGFRWWTVAVDINSMIVQSYNNASGLYEMTYSVNGWQRKESVSPQHFILPAGTIVHLEGCVKEEYRGIYGKVTGWFEKEDGSGHYTVQFSPNFILHTTMDIVRL